MPNPLPVLPPLYPAGANAPAGSLPIAPPQVPAQAPAQVVVAPQAPAPVPYAQASTGHAGADAILAAAHANGVVGWTPPAAPTVAPTPATAGDLQNAYQKAGGVTIAPAPSDPITPQVPLDTASPTMSSNASSRITAAAQSLVGSYCGPAGCANAVNKIAKIAGIPVPKTASAGDFEKGLANPKSGWVQVPASEADSAQIVTMKGGGGPNNPSGRHVEVHIGGGRTVGDPGRSSGYKIVTGKLPTNDPSAKFWKYTGDMSGPITHSPTAPGQTGTDQYGEPTFVKPTGEINGAYPGHVPGGASHDIVAGPASNIGAPPIAAHHSQVQPRAANGTFKPAPPEPPSGNNSFQQWLNEKGEEVKAGLSALPEIGADIARGPSQFLPFLKNEIPEMGRGLSRLGDALTANDLSNLAPAGQDVSVNGASRKELGAAAAQGPKTVVGAVHRTANSKGDLLDKLAGPDSIPAQVTESFAHHPIATTAAIAGGFGGVSGALGLGAKLAGPGALGDALASEAASAKFFADPLNVHGVINAATKRVVQAQASSRVNPAPGDFVQSINNPNKFGRVVNTTGSGVTKSYTVETPSGQQKVAWHDIGRHADAANINEFVANNPGAERAFGVKNQSGRYQFRPGHSMQEEPSAPSAAPAEPPASAAAPPRLLPAPTEPAAPTAAPSSPPVAPAAPAGPAAPASPVVQAASPVTIPSVPPPVAAATPNVPAPAPALTVASTIAPVAAAAIARPIGTPLKLSGTKNAPTLQTLPNGPFEPTVSKAFSKTGGMRTGSQKHTQTFVLVGKPNPSANGGVQATHVVIAAKSAPEASAPAAALPVWSVYNVDPRGKSMLPGTSVGLGDMAATGLTRKDAVAQAKALSAAHAAPKSGFTPQKTADRSLVNPSLTTAPPKGPYQYHGTSTAINDLSQVYETTQHKNLYGPGFYTTDNITVADSYTKKGKGTNPSVYKVNWVGAKPPHLIDLDKQLPDDVFKTIKSFAGEDAELDQSKPGREVYNSLKEAMAGNDLTSDEAQDTMQDIADELHEKGYDGFAHTGGVGKLPHNVEIYFHPLTPAYTMRHPDGSVTGHGGEANIKLTPVDTTPPSNVISKRSADATTPPPVTPESHAQAQAFRAKQAAPAAIPEPLHESVPASAPPADIMPPRPVVAQAKAEKADPRTGMTPTQSAFLVDSLKKAIPNLPEKADAAISTRDKYGTVSGSRTLDAPTNITIQVPDDGRFTIGGQDQAKALIDRLVQPAAPATRNYNQRPPRLIPKPSDEGYDAHIHNEKEVARAKAAKSNGIKNASAPTVGKKTERGAAVIRTPNLGPQVEKAKGWIKDTHAKLLDMTEGNLHMLGLHASPESYMAANALAGAHGPVKIVADAMHRIGEIAKPIGGVNTVHDVLFSSNLRGKAHNWRDLAADAQTKPVTYQANPSAPTVLDRDMADMLGKLEETDPAKHQHTKTVSAVQHAKDLAAQAGETGNDKPLRNYLTKKFKDGEDTAMAAARAIMPDSEYHHTRIHPLYKEAKEIWKSDISPVFTASHASNEGVFQGKNRLGEEGVYVPTIPADANGDPLLGNPGASNPAFSSPSNRSNHYATGQSAHYDHSLPTLRNKLLGSIKRNAQADLFKKLTADGTMQHPSQGLIETGHGGSKRTLMTLKDGTVHEATSVPINTQGDRMIIPTAIKHELAPILGSVLPDWGSSGDVPDNAFTHFMDFINGVGLSGATTMAYHDQNLFSVLADELTRSMGIPGAAVNTVPFAPRALALRKASMMRGGSKNSRILDSELAKAGGLPTEYATQTLSKEYAANTGANFAFKGITRTDRGRLEPPKASLSPVLFGPSGVDIHVRRSLWDIARMENGIKPGESMLVKPGETIIDKHTGKPKNVGEWKDAEKAAACLKTVSRVGRYILSVDSQIVRFLKKWHVNPAAEAGMTMLNNQVRYLHPRNFIRGLAASILGYMLFYKVWHGHFFGENGKTDGNRFGEVSVKYNRQAYHPNVLAMMNPMYNRALKSSGISGAIDAKMNGGNDRQVIEGGELGPLNEGLRMGASGPFVGGFMRTALGVEPYITQITNRRTGKPDIGMYPAMGKVPNDAPGWAKAHLMSAIEGGNPTLQLGEQVLGLGHEGEKTRDLPPEGRAAVALGSLLGVPIRGPQKGGKPIMPRDRGSGMGLGSLGKMRM